MPLSATPLRNELMIRLDDALLGWIDRQRGRQGRSTFIRDYLQKEAVRELPKDGHDDRQE